MEYNMKQEEKDLMIQDLSCRLPYGVKAYVKNYSKLDRKWYEGIYSISSIHPSLNNILVKTEKYSVEIILGYCDYEIKPYLFPLTEEILDNATEESNTLYKELICSDSDLYIENNKSNILLLQAKIRSSVIKYFHIHHIDYNGLIEKGLAIDATNLNIY